MIDLSSKRPKVYDIISPEKEHNAKLLTKEFSESRLAKMADLISVNFYADVNDYLLEEIDEEFVIADIEKYL